MYSNSNISQVHEGNLSNLVYFYLQVLYINCSFILICYHNGIQADFPVILWFFIAYIRKNWHKKLTLFLRWLMYMSGASQVVPVVKNLPANAGGKGDGTPLPVLLPGKSHGWRSLVGCSPWDCEESDTTEWLPFHFSLPCTGEGNGTPLQCSCLENPRDGEPGGLPSMGLHRVEHDWSDLAAAAAVM